MWPEFAWPNITWPKILSVLTVILTVVLVVVDIVYHQTYGSYGHDAEYKLGECILNSSVPQESCNSTNRLVHLIHDAIEAVVEKQRFSS